MGDGLWQRRRWVLAAVVIGATVVAVGFVLRAAGWGGTADVVQVVSLPLTVTIGVLGWVRQERQEDGLPEPQPESPEDLMAQVERLLAAAGQVERSLEVYNRLGQRLGFVRVRLSEAVTRLDGDRRSLQAEIDARRAEVIPEEGSRAQGDRLHLEAENARLQRELEDTRRRLAEAERLRDEVGQRLTAAERQREQAQRLHQETEARLQQARQRLEELQGRILPAGPSRPVLPPPAPDADLLMGSNDRQLAEEILKQADAELAREANTVEHIHDEVTRHTDELASSTDDGTLIPHSDNGSPMPPRRERRSVLTAAAVTVIVVSVAAAGTYLKIRMATAVTPWTYTTGGAVSSSPVVADDTLYIGSDDSKVYALDAKTGAERWTHRTSGAISSSPVVADGTLYIGSYNNKVYALDAKTGAERWTHPTDSAVRSSPVVADGTLYIGSYDSKVYALDAKTGAERWTHRTGGAVSSSPVVADGTLYIGSDDNKLYALDAKTGAERWTHPTYSAVRSSPVVADDTLYIGSDDNKVYALGAKTGRFR